MQTIKNIPISKIEPNAHQPRKTFNGIDELAASIQESGLLEPIMVRPHGDGFQVIHGERRFRAMSSLGADTIPAIVRHATDDEVFRLALVENMQRENLQPMEEARAFKTLQDQGQTQEQVAATIGKGQSYVAHKLRLLKLPNFLSYFLECEILSENHVRQVMRLKKIYAPGATADLTVTDTARPDETSIKLFLCAIRPEGRVLVFKPKPYFSDIWVMFAKYVLKHKNRIPQWEAAALWWLCFAAAYDVPVAKLTIALNKFEARHRDAAAMWYLRYDGVKSLTGDDSLGWAFYDDLKQSGSLELNMEDPAVYSWWNENMMAVARRGRFALPTNYKTYCGDCAEDVQGILTGEKAG